MSQLGIDVIRLNPQEFHMSALADLFHRLANSLDLQKDSPQLQARRNADGIVARHSAVI